MESVTSYSINFNEKSGHGLEVLLIYFVTRFQIVNICFVGNPRPIDFVLVDAGSLNVANEIISVTEERFWYK